MQVFGPVGQCIYCCRPSKKPDYRDLSDEHIVPAMLNGQWLLRKASCADCADITKRFEGYVGRKQFWQFRATEVPRKRRKKDAPETLPLLVRYPDRVEEVAIPVRDHPSIISFPVWNWPTLLTGGSPEDVWAEDYEVTFWIAKPITMMIPSNITKLMEKWRFDGALSFSYDPQVDTRKFARFIAKIAHSYAVANYGLNLFCPFLLDIILGRADCTPYLIGANPERQPPTPFKSHELSLRIREFNGTTYVFGRVRLFTDLGSESNSPGTPDYWVVVGDIPRPPRI